MPNSSRGASCRGRVWRCLGRCLGAVGLRLQAEVAELDVAGHHCFTGGHGQAGQLPARQHSGAAGCGGSELARADVHRHPRGRSSRKHAQGYTGAAGAGAAHSTHTAAARQAAQPTPPAAEPGCRSRGPTCGRSVQAAWHPPLLQVPAGTRCDAGPAAGGDANMVSIVTVKVPEGTVPEGTESCSRHTSRCSACGMGEGAGGPMAHRGCKQQQQWHCSSRGARTAINEHARMQSR